MKKIVLLFVVMASIFIFSAHSVLACGLHGGDKEGLEAETQVTGSK